MRLFEFILLCLLLILVAVLVSKRGRQYIVKNASFVFFFVGLMCGLQVAAEGFRWQLVPLYTVAIGLVLFLYFCKSGSSTMLRWTLGVVVFISLPFAALLPNLIPIPNFPSPTGLQMVGTSSVHFIDEGRAEIYGRNKGSNREFMVQFWYPTTKNANSQFKRASFLPHAEKASKTIAQRLGLPSFILDHAPLLKSHSFEGSPINKDLKKTPLLVFSHGYESLRGQSITLMEELASHGYIVASMEHTYGASVTIFPDGRIEFIDRDTLTGEGIEYDNSARRLGEQWQQDIEFLIHSIQVEPHASEMIDSIYQHIDLQRVGLFGHSTGGGVATRTCKMLGCLAFVGLDAWMAPVPLEDVAKGSDTPSLFLMSESWSSDKNTKWLKTFIDASSDSKWYSIAGTKHFDFSDISFLSPLTNKINLTGDIDSYRGQEIQRKFIVDFFNRYLKPQTSSKILTYEEFPEVTQTY